LLETVIEDVPPVAQFTVEQNTIVEGDTVKFIDQTTGNPTMWMWDFGDGETSTIQSPWHVYSVVGSYYITLTVTNVVSSNTEIKSNYITVIHETATVTDIDGNTYTTVKIGNQWWMQENLRTTHYADGTSLVDGTDAGDITDDHTTKYFFWWNDNPENGDENGAYYTWAGATNGESSETNPSAVQGASQDGWHLSSDDDCKELEMFIGMSQVQVEMEGERGTNEGDKLKSTDGWEFNGNGTDNYGFSALPYSYRYHSGFNSLVLGEFAMFWTSTEFDNAYSWNRQFHSDETGIIRDHVYPMSNGLSVRCVKD